MTSHAHPHPRHHEAGSGDKHSLPSLPKMLFGGILVGFGAALIWLQVSGPMNQPETTDAPVLTPTIVSTNPTPAPKAEVVKPTISAEKPKVVEQRPKIQAPPVKPTATEGEPLLSADPAPATEKKEPAKPTPPVATTATAMAVDKSPSSDDPPVTTKPQPELPSDAIGRMKIGETRHFLPYRTYLSQEKSVVGLAADPATEEVVVDNRYKISSMSVTRLADEDGWKCFLLDASQSDWQWAYMPDKIQFWRLAATEDEKLKKDDPRRMIPLRPEIPFDRTNWVRFKVQLANNRWAQKQEKFLAGTTVYDCLPDEECHQRLLEVDMETLGAKEPPVRWIHARFVHFGSDEVATDVVVSLDPNWPFMSWVDHWSPCRAKPFKNAVRLTFVDFQAFNRKTGQKNFDGRCLCRLDVGDSKARWDSWLEPYESGHGLYGEPYNVLLYPQRSPPGHYLVSEVLVVQYFERVRPSGNAVSPYVFVYNPISRLRR